MSLLRLFSTIVIALSLISMVLLLPGDSALGQGKQKENAKGGQKHVFSGPAPAHPYDVILARPTDKSVTVSVLAYKETKAYLTYGTVAGRHSEKSREQLLKPDAPVEWVLGDLRPDTSYFYRLHLSDPSQSTFAAEGENTFHTQRKPGSPFVFTIQSDSHLDQGTRGSLYERTLANALADKTDFHVDIGDTFMTDKYEKHKDSLPQYIAQRYYFGLLSRSAPLFLVLGNHDGERMDRLDGTAESMPVWSNLTRKKYFPTPYPDGFYTGSKAEVKHAGRLENYYAFEWGDALIIALDPFWTTPRIPRSKAGGNWDRTLGKEQYDWLVKTLAESKAKHKFVFIHHLVGGLDESARGGSEAAILYEWGGKSKDGKDEFKLKRPGWPMPIHQLLVKHKVAIVFHGHDHFFAHQELDGIAYVMAPQPGHPGFDRLRNAEEYGYIRGDFLSPAGHVRVSVSPDKATVDYVRSYLPSAETANRKNGVVAHSFVIKR